MMLLKRALLHSQFTLRRVPGYFLLPRALRRRMADWMTEAMNREYQLPCAACGSKRHSHCEACGRQRCPECARVVQCPCRTTRRERLWCVRMWLSDTFRQILQHKQR